MSKPSSTMSFAEARAEADKWGNLIRALARLQETAETLGAFEQNRSERQVELDRLAGEIGAAHEQLAELQKAVAEAETMATSRPHRVCARRSKTPPPRRKAVSMLLGQRPALSSKSSPWRACARTKA